MKFKCGLCNQVQIFLPHIFFHPIGEAMDESCPQGATAASAAPIVEGAVANLDPTHMAEYVDSFCNHHSSSDIEHQPSATDYLRLPNSRSPLMSSSSDEEFNQKPSLFVTSSTTGEVGLQIRVFYKANALCNFNVNILSKRCTVFLYLILTSSIYNNQDFSRRL